MKKVIGVLMVVAVTQMGCGGFWGGAAAGVVGTGAGYEIQAERQMNQLNQELKDGKITQQEYNIRKDQIQKGSVLK